MLPVEEIDIEPHSIIEADALDLPYEDESFHAIVTDPPYGLAFMGKSWDQFEPKEYQEWCEEWASEALRVLKPGGHMLAFSGTRTYHRMATGVEDAGFEIRDKIDYLYGSGFPKNHDISKAIDKKLGKKEERNVVDEDVRADRPEGTSYQYNTENRSSSDNGMFAAGESDVRITTIGATKQARQWEGFGTALKPAHEPIVVARKPIEEDTIAGQVMATGTGALNIDGCRIEVVEKDGRQELTHDGGDTFAIGDSPGKSRFADGTTDRGRYPANIILDIEAAQMLDEEVGDKSVPKAQSNSHEEEYESTSYEIEYPGRNKSPYGGSGGPSRFFYASKASKSERTANERIDNSHPTVKPVDLMQYLVRLVTAEGQKVCDPFLGSGTTLLACEEENRVGYGSDMNKEYCDIATKRLGIRMGTELGSFMDY